MRLLAEFALVLITIAFVQSKPVISQVNNLEAVLAAYPQYSALINELSNFAAQVTNVFSPSQLYSLEQQALQLAEKVYNGNTDINTAVNQLFEQLQQYLGSYPELLSTAQSLVQQLMNAVLTVLPNLSSNLGTRSATAAHTDIFALASQFGFNNLDDILAAFPQYSDLINQLVNVATQVSNALSPSQLYSLEQQALQVGQNVFNGNTDINTAVNQLLQQLQQYLGTDSPILANVQPLVQQLVNTVLPLLSSNLGTRSATVPDTDLFALIDQLQLNSLDAVLAAFPQYTDLINELVNVAGEVSNALSPSQLYSLEQQAIQVAQNVFNGNTDINTAVNQLFQQLQQYLGADSPILTNVEPLMQQLVTAVLGLTTQ